MVGIDKFHVVRRQTSVLLAPCRCINDEEPVSCRQVFNFNHKNAFRIIVPHLNLERWRDRKHGLLPDHLVALADDVAAIKEMFAGTKKQYHGVCGVCRGLACLAEAPYLAPAVLPISWHLLGCGECPG